MPRKANPSRPYQARRKRFLVTLIVYRTLTTELDTLNAKVAAEIGRRLYLSGCESLFRKESEQLDTSAELLPMTRKGRVDR